MTKREIILGAGALVTIGIVIGQLATNWGHLSRCKSSGVTFFLLEPVVCKVKETK